MVVSQQDNSLSGQTTHEREDDDATSVETITDDTIDDLDASDHSVVTDDGDGDDDGEDVRDISAYDPALYQVNSDDIDLSRFSIGPATEVALTWWNRRARYTTRRENNDHMVLVLREEFPIWHTHIALIAACSLIVVFFVGAFTGMPWWSALLLMLLCVLISVVVLRFERYLVGDSQYHRGDVICMDTPVWEGMKQLAFETLQKKSHQDSKLRSRLPVGSRVLSNVDTRLQQQCEQHEQAVYATRLRKSYDEDISQAKALGKGVRGCTCQACQACSEHGVVPKHYGVEVATKMHKVLVGDTRGIGEIVSRRLDGARKSYKLRRVEQSKQQRHKVVQDDAAARRKASAKEYVKQRRNGGKR